jgi:hypothetical protein
MELWARDYPKSVPAGFICPLSLGIMVDPVTAADGTSFERAAI